MTVFAYFESLLLFLRPKDPGWFSAVENRKFYRRGAYTLGLCASKAEKGVSLQMESFVHKK